MDVEQFVAAALQSTKTWKHEDVQASARLALVEGLLGSRHKDLLRGDIHSLWSIWFVESIADPARYLKREKTYAHVLYDVTKGVRVTFPHALKLEVDKLARTIASEVWGRVELMRQNSRRSTVGREERIVLLDRAGSPPRCWICGHAFSPLACDQFLGEQRPTSHDLFVDVLRPSGLRDGDHCIEIEHITPWTYGGREGENLALACRWCNRSKGAYRSIYDVAGYPRRAGPNSLGLGTLPNRFWVVRLLATQRTCEHHAGCTLSSADTEMTVEPINLLGSLVPSNLRMVCPDHHWLGANRLQPRNRITQLWGIE